VHLAPGQSRQLTFTLNPRDLSLVDEGGKRSVQPGDYSIFVGGSQPTGARQQTVDFTIHGSKPLPE
jgi:beta-glucosidase